MSYTCYICNKEFKNSNECKIHIKDCKKNIIYTCDFCNKEFSFKSNWKRHINDNCKIKRQEECSERNENEINKVKKQSEQQLEKYIEKISILEKRVEQLDTQLKQQLEFYTEKKTMFEKQIEQLEKQLERTEKQLEKTEKQLEKTEKKSNKLEKQLDKHLNVNSISNNNSNSNSNNNNNINSNNINITVFDHGKEDYSMVDEIFNKILTNKTIIGRSIYKTLITNIHINDDYPQYKNIAVTDKNRKHCKIRKDNKWITTDFSAIDELLNRLVNYSKLKIKEYYEENLENKGMKNKLEDDMKYMCLCDPEILAILKDNECDDNDLINEINIDNIDIDRIRPHISAKRCEEFYDLVVSDTIKLLHDNKDEIIKT